MKLLPLALLLGLAGPAMAQEVRVFDPAVAGWRVEQLWPRGRFAGCRASFPLPSQGSVQMTLSTDDAWTLAFSAPGVAGSRVAAAVMPKGTRNAMREDVPLAGGMLRFVDIGEAMAVAILDGRGFRWEAGGRSGDVSFAAGTDTLQERLLECRGNGRRAG
jgi:hypothetical protein